MTTTPASPGQVRRPAVQEPGARTEPSAPPASLRVRQRLRTREDLIRAAIEVITVNGLDAATVDRITGRAGTSRATLYAHFPGGRADLLAEAYQTIGRDLVDAASILAARQANWIDRLCAYPSAMLELAAKRELGLFYNVSGPQLVGIKRRGSGSQQTLDAIIAELRHAQEAGDVSSQLDIEAIAALLVGAIREAGIDTSRDPSTASRRLAAFRQLLEALSLN
jgi:AcrR family transcriptional regulator